MRHCAGGGRARGDTAMKTLGLYLIEALEAVGTRHLFGIPGVHNLELYRGVARSRIRHVTGRHEQGLGFMADGYARVSGRPGVCFTITGPGVTNIATAMAQAGASDPATDAMIALGGEVASALETDGKLAGLLVLGPKRSGMPYEAEEIAFLGAQVDITSQAPGPIHPCPATGTA